MAPIRFPPITPSPPTEVVSEDRVLVGSDNGTLFLIDARFGGFSLQLPPLDGVEVGTKYQFVILAPPEAGVETSVLVTAHLDGQHYEGISGHVVSTEGIGNAGSGVSEVIFPWDATATGDQITLVSGVIKGLSTWLAYGTSTNNAGIVISVGG